MASLAPAPAPTGLREQLCGNSLPSCHRSGDGECDKDTRKLLPEFKYNS
jgi:hypothetical protein